MDSSQAVVATSGALQNFTSYLNGTLNHLGTAFQGSSEYISETLGVPPALVYSSLAAAVAVPLTMSRYGWSRGSFSPYSSMTGGPPNVTDEDFSYITSQDLDDPNLGAPIDGHRARSNQSPDPEDDVLLIKNKGVTYPAHFPAYTIGDGKLRVMDVKDRVGLMMDLSDRTIRRVKLLYKGRQMKEPAASVREYGVKNKSEIMAVVPEGGDGSSASEEEMVIVGDDHPSKSSKKKRKSKKKRGDKGPDGNSTSSPRDSNSAFEPHSPPGSSVDSGPGSKANKQLDELTTEFRSKWQPLFKEFIKNTPTDAKKREDEHRRLSESVMQHVIIKTDGVETEGIPEIRQRRKDLVQEVQAALKEIDKAKALL